MTNIIVNPLSLLAVACIVEWIMIKIYRIVTSSTIIVSCGVIFENFKTSYGGCTAFPNSSSYQTSKTNSFIAF